MHPFSVLLFLSPLLGARAFSLDSRGSGPRRLDVRSTTDVCAPVMNTVLIVLGVNFGVITDSGSNFCLNVHVLCS